MSIADRVKITHNKQDFYKAALSLTFIAFAIIIYVIAVIAVIFGSNIYIYIYILDR